jgi:flagellar hook protein FlgE
MGFTASINGLNATAQSIEAISTNVANASTVGYKTGELTFGDQLVKALQSGEGGRISTGVSDDNVRRSFSAGALRTTTSPLDMAISGSGFFRVVPQVGATDGQIVYTRAGQFSSDKAGNIVNANGLFLTGYLPNAAGDGVTGELGILKIPEATMPPKQSTTSTMSVYLDSRKPTVDATKSFDSTDSTSYSDLTTQTVYDATGNQHSLALYFRRTGENNVDVYAALDGKFFDAAGQPTTSDIAGGVVKSIVFKDGVSTKTEAEKLPVTLNGMIAKTDGTSAPLSLKVSIADTLMRATAITVRNTDQDGYGIGEMTGISVDETGKLFGQYSNGESRIGGQVVLAKFNSPTGLSSVTANAFHETYSSGAPTLAVGSAAGFGVIRAETLEESNIDMAAELVNLMVQQRNFQANSQSFRTQDELLKNVINLA